MEPETRVARGQIRWYTFRFPDKRRPVLILTRDPVAGVIDRVTVAPITTTIRGLQSEVLLDESDAMSVACAINLDGIHTIEVDRLGELITQLAPHREPELRSALLHAFGFAE